MRWIVGMLCITVALLVVACDPGMTIRQAQTRNDSRTGLGTIGPRVAIRVKTTRQLIRGGLVRPGGHGHQLDGFSPCGYERRVGNAKTLLHEYFATTGKLSESDSTGEYGNHESLVPSRRGRARDLSAGHRVARALSNWQQGRDCSNNPPQRSE
jgi:hypothetical protein